MLEFVAGSQLDAQTLRHFVARLAKVARPPFSQAFAVAAAKLACGARSRQALRSLEALGNTEKAQLKAFLNALAKHAAVDAKDATVLQRLGASDLTPLAPPKRKEPVIERPQPNDKQPPSPIFFSFKRHPRPGSLSLSLSLSLEPFPGFGEARCSDARSPSLRSLLL